MRTLRHLFLTGTAAAAGMAVVSAARAQDLPSLPALSSGDAMGWSMDHASAEFGGQAFIEKPGSTPNNSAAKFNQFGTLTNPVFLNFFDVGAQGYDYKYTFEALGQNVATDNQAYEVDLNQPGQQYLSFGYYSVPDLRSNTAETPYYGVGSGSLWMPPTVVQQLYKGIFNGGSYATGAGNNSTVPVQLQTLGIPPGTTTKPPLGCYLPGQTGTLACAKGVTPVQTTVQENVHQINVGIQRDAGQMDYRWTPTPAWDFQAGYTDEHRYGVQEEGMLFSSSTTTPMAAVPMPVNDYTQNAFISGEYYGISPWGMKWNGIVKYAASIYTDEYNSFTAMNPFGGPGSPGVSGVPDCPVANAGDEAELLRLGPVGDGAEQRLQHGHRPGRRRSARLCPQPLHGDVQLQCHDAERILHPHDDQQRGREWLLSPDIERERDHRDRPVSVAHAAVEPGWPDRYDAVNNVITTQILPNLQNKLTYRYYSDQNNTPPLTLSNWIVNDSAIASSSASSIGGGSYAPHTTLFQSYTKQNASEQLTWNPASWATVGRQYRLGAV